MKFKCLYLVTFLLFSCAQKRVSTSSSGAASPNQNELKVSKSMAVAVEAASSAQCPAGGTVVLSFEDQNGNGLRDEGESVLSVVPVCAGERGRDGKSAGLVVERANLAACPAGGSVFKTFSDDNNNGILDADEFVSSVSTLCNGLAGQNGSDGQSALLTVKAATLAQCPNGGAVYSSAVGGQSAPDVTVLCNGRDGASGTDGTDGEDGEGIAYAMGAVGAAVKDKAFTACHHDYLYLPNAHDPSRGWLTFRHQANGSEDEGIGSSGFQIWNVDIPAFALVSEQGALSYCQLNWSARERVLSYVVVTDVDGHQGEKGEIRF